MADKERGCFHDPAGALHRCVACDAEAVDEAYERGFNAGLDEAEAAYRRGYSNGFEDASAKAHDPIAGKEIRWAVYNVAFKLFGRFTLWRKLGLLLW